MRKVLTVLAFAAVILALVLSFTSFASRIAVFALLFVSCLCFFLAARGNLCYSKAMKLASTGKKKDFDKALPLFRKVLSLDATENYQLMAASVLLQSGERKEPFKVLSRLKESRKQAIAHGAAVTLSMYYRAEGDLAKAIALCEEAHAQGYADKSLYSNLGTYYLQAGRYEDFSRLLKEKKAKDMKTSAMTDFRSAEAAMEGSWKKAGDILTELFRLYRPGFAAPYVHMALVHLHYGNSKGALEMLEKAGKVRFNSVGLFGKETVLALTDLVRTDPVTAVTAVHEFPKELLSGRLPAISKASALPPLQPEPVFGAKQKEKEEREEPDVELNDEDEAWLKRHK